VLTLRTETILGDFAVDERVPNRQQGRDDAVAGRQADDHLARGRRGQAEIPDASLEHAVERADDAADGPQRLLGYVGQ